MTVTDEIIQANRSYATKFDQGSLPIRPGRKLAVLTCMDARLHPLTFLGIEAGDAHIISNAGGRASEDAIRSLIISSHLLGTEEYIVIHHTDCGMTTLRDKDLRDRLAERTGVTCDIDFLTFADLEESVLIDVHRIKGSPFIPADVSVRGFVYDVHTGGLTEVQAAPSTTLPA